jgi:hypothetical protein
MAKYTGKDGTAGAYVITSFEIDEEVAVGEYVDTTTAGWEDNEAGSKKWAGRMELTEAPTFDIGDRVESCAFFTGAETKTGDIRIVKVNTAVDRVGQKILTYPVDFRGCGALVTVSGSGS